MSTVDGRTDGQAAARNVADYGECCS